MSRLVAPKRAGAARGEATLESGLGGAVPAGAGTDEKPLERIAKYIPAEILAFYTLWTQAAATLPWPDLLTWICVAGAVIGVIVTYIYFDRFFPDADPDARRLHRIISPIAFAIYGYTIMGSVVPEVFVSGIALMATALITLASYVAVPSRS